MCLLETVFSEISFYTQDEAKEGGGITAGHANDYGQCWDGRRWPPHQICDKVGLQSEPGPCVYGSFRLRNWLDTETAGKLWTGRGTLRVQFT